MNCPRCKRTMSTADGCERIVFPGGASPVPYGSEPGVEGVATSSPLPRCRDCGARLGFLHHAYCVVQACPRCKGQLLSCACWDNLSADECRRIGR